MNFRIHITLLSQWVEVLLLNPGERDSKIRAQGLFTTTWPFDSILVFYVVFKTLEAMKLLLTKFQKH